MWVSRREFDSLRDRVKKIEDSTRYDDPNYITVYNLVPGGWPYGYPIPSQRIAVKDLIMRVLNHLGMGLKYREGQPAGVDLAKVNVVPDAAHGSSSQGEKNVD